MPGFLVPVRTRVKCFQRRSFNKSFKVYISMADIKKSQEVSSAINNSIIPCKKIFQNWVHHKWTNKRIKLLKLNVKYT